MKSIKFIVLLISLLFLEKESIASDSFTAEIVISNKTTNRTMNVKIIPVSMIFNGWSNYDLNAKHKNSEAPWRYDYIYGRNDSLLQFAIQPGLDLNVNQDYDLTVSATSCSVGFGTYKFEIWSDDESIRDTFTIEWDAAYPYSGTSWDADINILYYNNNSNPRIYFKWGNGTREYPISYVNRQIVAWDQQYGVSGTDSVRRLRSKDFGNFIYDTSNSNAYVEFPQDSRADCSPYNQDFSDTRCGVLCYNLTINKDIYTRDTLVDNPTNIIVTPDTYLKLNSDKIFSMITPIVPSGGYTNLIVQEQGLLF